MYDVLVVGAGLTGATAARLLAEGGHDVLVLEHNDFVGGNCADERTPDGFLVQRFGPHVLHTDSQVVWDFCSRFAELVPYHHRIRTFVDGMFLPFPINRDTICDLFGARITTDEVADFLASEIKGSTFNHPPQNFRDVIVSQVGQRLYEKFFQNYTRKQWQLDPTELTAEVAGRIPVRQNRDSRAYTERYQGLPADGYSDMIRRMLDHPGIELRLSTDYFADRYNYEDNARQRPIVYTGKLDSFFNFAYGKLGYRSMRYEFRTLPIRRYQPAPVVNYPNDFDFTRVIEYSQMNGLGMGLSDGEPAAATNAPNGDATPDSALAGDRSSGSVSSGSVAGSGVSGGSLTGVDWVVDEAGVARSVEKTRTAGGSPRSVICREYPAPEGVPSYVVLTPENMTRRTSYQAKASVLETAGKVYFVGRLAEYRSMNMDEAILSAMTKLAPLLEST